VEKTRHTRRYRIGVTEVYDWILHEWQIGNE
jgi:hypothetical protein